MTTKAYLLRAVNLGATRRLPMQRLREQAVALGATDVRTVLASGNLLAAAPGAERDFASRLAESLEAEFGFPVPIVVVGAETLQRALTALDTLPPDAQVPTGLFFFDPDAADGSTDDAGGCGDRQARVEELARTTGEAAIAGPGFASVRYLSGTTHASRLTSRRLDAAVGATATARNARTVAKILAAMPAAPPAGPGDRE